MYRVGEYAVASVKVDGADALKSKASIQTNAKNKDGSAASVTFIAKIYGEISSVDVVQNDKAEISIIKSRIDADLSKGGK